jgi:hypothetical protein
MDPYEQLEDFPYQDGEHGSVSASGSSNVPSWNAKSKSGSRRSGGKGGSRKDNSWNNKGQQLDGSSSGGGSSKPTPHTMSGKTQTESDLTHQEESKQHGKYGPGSNKSNRRGGKRNRGKAVFHPSEINYAKSESHGQRHGNQRFEGGPEDDYDLETQNAGFEGGQQLRSPVIPPSSRIYGNYQGACDPTVQAGPALSASIFAMDPMRYDGAEF